MLYVLALLLGSVGWIPVAVLAVLAVLHVGEGCVTMALVGCQQLVSNIDNIMLSLHEITVALPS